MAHLLSLLMVINVASAAVPPVPYVHRTSAWTANAIHLSTATGECNMTDPSEVDYNFWQHIYPNFCIQFDFSDEKYFEASYTSADYIEDPDNGDEASIATPPPNSGMYQPVNGNPWRFNFRFDPLEQAGNSTGNTTCTNTCSEALESLSQGPCGRTGGQMNHMTSEGSFDVGCGTYHFFIASPDPDETNCHIDDSHWNLTGASKKEFTLVDAVSAIESFCVGNESHSMLVDTASSHRPGLLQNQSAEYPERLYRFEGRRTGIDIFATFADVLEVESAAGCNNHSSQNFYVSEYADRCREILYKTLHRCNNDVSHMLTSGGYTLEHQAEHGCVVWQLYPYDLDS
ncbi:uncharacterized protein BCR38DRAFT_487457 [Pseudomassariella vexata]|uniref:Uncharacterized protein n=1 Tax=Pseudomassariella vexata TaxID=1141098 RepID=A0A1Y2DRJ4_9PEZI|nr:uncharacterized protein BCR38DRAFT_487457 [Pseudomassariella vexata]ORY61716.1 hypothetical protein BCR38DRAFT_487457 [Pseudomassariella vexata]